MKRLKAIRLILKHIKQKDIGIRRHNKNESSFAQLRLNYISIGRSRKPDLIQSLLHEYYHIRQSRRRKENRIDCEYKAELFAIRVMERFKLDRTQEKAFINLNWSETLQVEYSISHKEYKYAYCKLKVEGWI